MARGVEWRVTNAAIVLATLIESAFEDENEEDFPGMKISKFFGRGKEAKGAEVLQLPVLSAIEAPSRSAFVLAL